ncbi:MAG: CsgG/HfaB family protein [Myxococcaceae bacterium]
MTRRFAALALGLALLAPPALAAEKKPVRLAVLYFDVLTKDDELFAFSKGLAAMMITDLATASNGLQIVERDRIESILAELKLGDSRFADKSQLSKVGKLLLADFVVTGTLIKAGKVQSIELKLYNQATSAIVYTQRVKLKDDDVMDAEQQLVTGVLGNLDALKNALGQRAPVPFPTVVKYSLALNAKDQKDTATATKLLKEVVAERPEFALAKLDLMTLTQ